MSARPSRVLIVGLIGAPVAFVLATVLTTVWFERVYVPSIAGDD